MIRLTTALAGLFVLLFAFSACSKRSDQKTEPGMPKPVSKIEGAKADHSAADAVFAMGIRDYPRAQEGFEKALEIRPDMAEWWENLGYIYKLQNKSSDARDAYKKALSIYERFYEQTDRPETGMRQVVMLVLLRRDADAKALVERLAKKHPQNFQVQNFMANKGLEKMLADPGLQSKRL